MGDSKINTKAGNKVAICKKCRNQIVVINGKGKCLNCGYEYISYRYRKAFIDANRKEIIDDYLHLGLLTARRKWGIGVSTFYRMPEIGEIVKKRQNNNRFMHLPKLPAFNYDWSEETQAEWLRAYNTLLGQNGDRYKL